MTRDPKEGWGPNGSLRQAHELALSSDYKKCETKEEREFKYVHYFVKEAKRLCRNRHSRDYDYLNALDEKRNEQEEAHKEKLKQEAALEAVEPVKENTEDICLSKTDEGLFEALPLEDELSGIPEQLLQ